MKRSDFLRKLGIGIGAVVVVPRVIEGIYTKRDEQDITLPSIEQMVDVKLFFRGKELSHSVYTPQRVFYKIKTEGMSMAFDMPDLTFDINGRVDIDEICLFDMNGNDFGRIIYSHLLILYIMGSLVLYGTHENFNSCTL